MNKFARFTLAELDALVMAISSHGEMVNSLTEEKDRKRDPKLKLLAKLLQQAEMAQDAIQFRADTRKGRI